jgi:hypothetical protein
MEIAPMVAKILATEMDMDLLWQEKQVLDFKAMANKYVLKEILNPTF